MRRLPPTLHHAHHVRPRRVAPCCRCRRVKPYSSSRRARTATLLPLTFLPPLSVRTRYLGTPLPFPAWFGRLASHITHYTSHTAAAHRDAADTTDEARRACRGGCARPPSRLARALEPTRPTSRRLAVSTSEKMSTVRPAKQKKPTGGAAQMQPDRANADGAPCCLEVPKAPMAKVTEPCGCTTASAWAWRWNDEETTGLSRVGREGGRRCLPRTSADETACQGGDRHPGPRFSASAQGLWPWPVYFGPKFRKMCHVLTGYEDEVSERGTRARRASDKCHV